jgi:polar amino acid transport system permease protein
VGGRRDSGRRLIAMAQKSPVAEEPRRHQIESSRSGGARRDDRERQGDLMSVDQRGLVPPNRTVVPRKRYGRAVLLAVLAVLAAMMVNALVTNKAFQWDVVWHYFLSGSVLKGLLVTIGLTAVSMAIAIVLGIVLAVMRMSSNTVISNVSNAYIWFFRGTPLLVQLIFWFNLSALYPELTLGVPFGPGFVTLHTNSVITALGAAVLGLSLNEAAYMAEIVRGGLLSVPQGQVEAASALGMRGGLALRLIILPQAMRVIVPPTGNQVIGMLKTTSLVSVIATQELLYSVQLIYSRTFETIPLLMVACLWYLIVTTLLSFVQMGIERHYGQSTRTSRSRSRLARDRRSALPAMPAQPDVPTGV